MNILRKLIIVVAVLSAAACATPKETLRVAEPRLYFTATLSPAPTPYIITPATPLPTSTPFVYSIQTGDTFSQLAEKFKISQDELQAANPDIHPNSMPVGGTLLIPDGSFAFAVASTFTPAPVSIAQVTCHPSMDFGVTCFALIQNASPDILENVSAQITLLDENADIAASQTAFTPLNIIPPNSSLPVYVFFPKLSAYASAQIQLLSAVQASKDAAPYLPATIRNAVTQIDLGGYFAQASGEIALPAESKAATQVWVAAVAYDKDGRVVGLKRWEGGALQSAGSMQFRFAVSSLASKIDAVEFFVEARP